MQNYPKARAKDIVVSDYKNEILIYDLKTHKCHSLNKTATEIWQECNGRRSIAEIANRIYGVTPKESREELVLLTLNELAQLGLMEKGKEFEFDSSVTRREMIRNVGKATMIALPVISSVTAPEPSSAQSGSCPPITPTCPPSIPDGCPCTGCFVNCAVGLSCNSGICSV